jgi:phosphomevalonate kinase
VQRGEAAMRAVDFPSDLVLAAYWSGTSARTSELIARVDALRARSADSAAFATLREVAADAADAFAEGSALTFVERAAAFGCALEALGHAADAPIVPPALAELARMAEGERGAFLPSGAGGGDVAVWLGVAPPSTTFASRAEALALRPLALSVDRGGVRPESPS